MSLGLFDPTAAPFLLSYVTLFGAAAAAGHFIPHRMRPPGLDQRVQDVDALAFLAGGSRRFREAVVARLLAGRALIATGRRRFRIGLQPQTAAPAEADVLRLRPPIRQRDVDEVLGVHEEIVARRLVAGGLIIDDAERARIRFWATLPFVALLAFGGTEWAIGDVPASGALAALLLATVGLAVLRWARIDRRTRAGRTAVARAKDEAASAERADQG
jgi:uncharacterized protein (TIGR04222 family)